MQLRQYQKNLPPPPHSVWTNPIHFIACGFGVGTFPFFPGTMGTLAAVPLVIMLSHYSLTTYLIVCILLFIVGIYFCDMTNRDFKTSDHPAAVLDEIAAFPIAMIGIPIKWYWILLAFLLFRFFDIVKPNPIQWVDKNVHGGFGVMLDDTLAAITTVAIMQVVTYFFA